jgi:O-antigen/teichoic acid export membrane protein
MCYGFSQRAERMDLVSKSLFLRGLGSVLVFAIALLSTRSLVWATAGIAAAWCFVAVAYDLQKSPTATSIDRGLSIGARRHDVALFGTSLPLGLTTLAISLNTNVPRYFLEHRVGIAELGIYSALAYLPAVGGVVMGALGQSVSPRLSRYWAERRLSDLGTALMRAVLAAVALGILAILVGAMFGRELIQRIYSTEYSARCDVLLWLLLAAAFGYVSSIVGCALTAIGKYSIQPVVCCVAMLCSALTCHFTVPRFGATGAAWASVVSMSVQLVGTSIALLVALRASKHDELQGITAAASIA